MNKYQEAFYELEKMKQNHLQLTKEKYSHEPLKSDMVARRETHYKKVEIALQELVDRFGEFEATLDFLIELTKKNRETAYGRDIDYFHGVLDTLLKLKETFYKKQGK